VTRLTNQKVHNYSAADLIILLIVINIFLEMKISRRDRNEPYSDSLNFENSNGDLLKMLVELIVSMRELKDEVNSHKLVLKNCGSCNILSKNAPIKPDCSHSNPCYPGVPCNDSSDGPICGPW
jgi:hypothetical protein